MFFREKLIGLIAPWLIEKRCLDKAWRIDALAAGDPKLAEKAYDSIIEDLKPFLKKRRLGETGREALGRAYYCKCLGLLSEKRLEEGLKCFEDATRHISVEKSSIKPLLAKISLENEDLSYRAVTCYIDYLRLPASHTDTHTTQQILNLLEGHCRIREGDSTDSVSSKIRLNLNIAALPGPGPRLVVLGGAGQSEQYILKENTRIGRGKDNDVVLRDSSISEAHACLDAWGGGFLISNINSRSGIMIRGKRIDGPTLLTDGQVFTLGNTKFALYTEPRRFGNELEWPHFYLGIGFLCQGDYQSACRFFQKARQLKPERADTYWYLGRIFQAVDRLDTSFKYFAMAVKYDSCHAGAHFSWAQALESSTDEAEISRDSEAWHSKISQAISHYEKAVTSAPENETYVFALAKVYALAGKSDLASKAVQQAITLNSSNPEYRVFLAKVAREADKCALAVEAARAALRLQSDHREANYLLGVLYFEDKNYLEAAKRLEWVRSAEARDGKLVFSDKTEFAYRLGRSLYAVGKYIRAATVLSPIVKQSRDAMFYVGRCHSRKERFQKAAKIFRWVISYHGEDAEARFYLAATLGNLGEFDKAVSTLEPLIRNEEWASRVQCVDARLLICMGRMDEARQRLQQVRDDASHNIMVQFEKGRLACVLGDFDDAVPAFESALQMAPEDMPSHFWLGRALFGLKRHKSAEEHFKRVIVLAEGKVIDDKTRDMAADGYYYVGRIAEEHGDTDRALTHFEESRRYGNTSDQLAFYLASVYATAGKYSKALEELSSLAMKDERNRVVDYNLAAVSCSLAAQRMKAGHFGEAIPLLQQAVDRYSGLEAQEEAAEASAGLAEANFRMGVEEILSDNGRLASGVSALERAHAVHKGDMRCRYYLGVGYFLQQAYEKAVAMFRGIVDEGQSDTSVLKGLALSLEHAGHSEEAENTWKTMIDPAETESPQARIEARLGLAGLYARSEDWLAAANLLHDVLDDNAVSGFDAYPEVAKLAASYFSLAEDYGMAEKLIQDYLRGAASETAHAYLGAIIAQQNRPEEALTHLRNAVETGDANSAVLDLYDSVCRTLAARHILKGDLNAAELLLEDVTKRKDKLAPETEELRDAINMAILLGSSGTQVTDSALTAYDKAYEANHDNPHLRRNLAILYLKKAIHTEEERWGVDAERDAEQHWEKSHSLWNEFMSDRSYWDAFVENFNQNRKKPTKRDRLNKDDGELIRNRLVENLCDIHVGFAVAYVSAWGSSTGVQRHSKHALSFRGDGTFRKEFAEILSKESQTAFRGSEKDLLALVEFILKDLNPDDKECKEIAVYSHRQLSVSALWDKNISEFRKHLERAVDFDIGKEVVGSLGRDALRTKNTTHIKRFVDLSKIMIDAAKLSDLPHEDKKLLVFFVVLNMCVWAANQQASDYELSAFMNTGDFGKIIGSVFVEIRNNFFKR